MDNRHQGKYHLLVIFLIPILVASFVFIKNYYISIAILLAAVLIVYLVFKKL